ncbi:MAG: hypothetical protein ABIA76_05625 [Candidatus Diapherotrites archaeon]
MKRIFFALFFSFILFSACIDLTGLVYSPQCGDAVCDASEQETCYSDCEILPLYQFLEQGDSLINLAGRNEFEGQRLSLRVDGFNWVDDTTPEVKLALLSKGQIIKSQYFRENTRMQEIYPIKDVVFISEININDYRNYRTVAFEFIKYSGD